MYKFSFVILHYKTFKDTIECVNSILNSIKQNEFNIIIVDNASHNGSVNKLKEIYSEKSNIYILQNADNLGFAKGNNVGFRFAKYTLKSDFIALINNDTIITQPDFIERIYEKYKSEKFDLIGPDVLSLNSNVHQSPKPLSIRNKKVLKKLIIHHLILLFLNYLFIDEIIEKLKKALHKKSLIQNIQKKEFNFNLEMQNVKLSGCCLIFSPLFIEQYDGLFDKTFLYSEEEILFYMMRRDKKKTIYFPEIKIYHKEDATLNSIFKSNLKRRRFYYKNYIKSGVAFLQLINHDNILESWDD